MTTPRVHRARPGASSARTRLLDDAHRHGWGYRVRDPRATFEKNGMVIEVEYTASGTIRHASRSIDNGTPFDEIGKGTAVTAKLFEIIRDWMIPHVHPTTKGRG